MKPSPAWQATCEELEPAALGAAAAGAVVAAVLDAFWPWGAVAGAFLLTLLPFKFLARELLARRRP